ncbi:HEPN-associated N-terminal domain-containing protein [Arthrobacter gengyunqii]|uniref:RES domain-containing protein n=1 Tax=Arthrobacter gengyunqii TaxID=2886940 RepID=A0ABS8GHN1_9MICC|nr:RES domain-containing protein [Arthrobacter gengyunqii]
MDAIKAHNGIAPCDYCGGKSSPSRVSAPIEVLLELIVDGLRYEYEDPIHQMGWDGGYTGDVWDTWDLLWDLGITENEDVHKALANSIVTEAWCQRNPYEDRPAKSLLRGWEAFRQYVKHHRRFTFLVSEPTSQDGAGAIPMHAVPAAISAAVTDADLIKSIPARSGWWRIRPHDASESYSSATDLGTPPDAVAKDNRMTPKGIGAFYGASTSAGARAEVSGYASPSSSGSMGKFYTAAPLTVVDLRVLPGIPSLFDADRRHLRAPIEFMRGFVKDATKIADPSDVMNLDYIPTQVVAETFRYELGADGVLWCSSKDKTVTTCVLFVSSAEVADLGLELSKTKLVLDPKTVQHITHVAT